MSVKTVALVEITSSGTRLCPQRRTSHNRERLQGQQEIRGLIGNVSLPTSQVCMELHVSMASAQCS
jgi:hypothetical protein